MTCESCGGTGRRTLRDDVFRTYLRLHDSERPLTAYDLLEDGVGATAILNRLNTLEAAGLTKRTGKQGRRCLWAAESQ